MGSCVSTLSDDVYHISHNRYIACLQSILPPMFRSLIIEIEKDIGNDIEALYQRLLSGNTRITKTNSTIVQTEIYMYAGVIGLYYGVTSNEYKTITTNLLQYSNVDIEWLTFALEGLYTELTTPVSYQTTFNDNDCTTIPEECSILLLADFATGLERSNVVLREAKRIQPYIHMVIHGGDTYYSGTKTEQENNLVKPIQSIFPYAVIRCLRGNHDMYSGPDGFRYVQETIGQQATYFSITNSSLMIQGMDTSIYDVNPLLEGKTMVSLHADEVQWHIKKVEEARQQGKKIILFSHHEPITYNDNVGTLHDKNHPVNVSLCNQLQPIIPYIDAYFFGHQHNFMLYKDYTYKNNMKLRKPRLIGHGGCPVMSQTLETMYTKGTYDTESNDVPELLYGNDWKLGNNGSVIDTGFVILTCSKGIVRADYYNIHSTSLGIFEKAKCVHSEIL